GLGVCAVRSPSRVPLPPTRNKIWRAGAKLILRSYATGTGRCNRRVWPSRTHIDRREQGSTIVLREPVRTDLGRSAIGDDIRFRIAHVQEIRTQDEKGDDLAFQLSELRRSERQSIKHVEPDEAGNPGSTLQRKSTAKRLESSGFDVA